MAAKTLLAMLAAAALVLSASAIACPSLTAGDIVRAQLCRLRASF